MINKQTRKVITKWVNSFAEAQNRIIPHIINFEQISSGALNSITQKSLSGSLIMFFVIERCLFVCLFVCILRIFLHQSIAENPFTDFFNLFLFLVGTLNFFSHTTVLSNFLSFPVSQSD